MSANYDKGAGVTTWPMARRMGLAASPSYYGFENGLDNLAWDVRKQRLSVGPGVGLVPWITPGEDGGTGGTQTADPGGAAFNELLQLFETFAEAFNYVHLSALWYKLGEMAAADGSQCMPRPSPSALTLGPHTMHMRPSHNAHATLTHVHQHEGLQ